MLKLFFFASIASRLLKRKLLCKKSFFCAVSGGAPLGPLFFSCLFFHFRFLFQFLSMFSFFFLGFSFLIFYSIIFILFFSFSFLGCPKSVAALQDFIGKSAHSELALFALYWIVVTFPCGIVHILVVVRLRVVYGGRVGQVLPSYQNRQISALDETADAPQFSLFSFLSSLFSLLFSLLSFLSSSQFYQYLSLFSRFRSLPGAPRGGSPNSLGNNEHSEKALWPRENHTFEGGLPVFSGKKCTFLSGPFCRFGISPLLFS